MRIKRQTLKQFNELKDFHKKRFLPFCPPDDTSSATADGGDVCQDELSELDPVDPRL